mgnify:CR=1 FL=1
MGFKSKYHIIFPNEMVYKMDWPEGCDYCCPANVPSMLRDKLNVQTIAGEIKLIWNHEHRMEILKDNNITDEQLDDFLKADCSNIHFAAEGTRKRALKYLDKIGATGYVCADSYRDVLLFQAHFENNGEFPKK